MNKLRQWMTCVALTLLAGVSQAHSWTEYVVPTDGTVTQAGVTAKKQGSAGSVVIRVCTSEDEPHVEVRFSNGATGSTSGLNSDSDRVEIGSGCTVTVEANDVSDGSGSWEEKKGIDIEGSNNTVTVMGSGNSVDCKTGSTNNTINLGTSPGSPANNTDVDHNGTNATVNNVNGSNNTIHS